MVEIGFGPFFQVAWRQGGTLGLTGEQREPNQSLSPRRGTGRLGIQLSLLRALAPPGLASRPRGLQAHLASYLLKSTWVSKGRRQPAGATAPPGQAAGRRGPAQGTGLFSKGQPQPGVCFSGGPCSVHSLRARLSISQPKGPGSEPRPCALRGFKELSWVRGLPGRRESRPRPEL